MERARTTLAKSADEPMHTCSSSSYSRSSRSRSSEEARDGDACAHATGARSRMHARNRATRRVAEALRDHVVLQELSNELPRLRHFDKLRS